MYETKYRIGKCRTIRTVYERTNLWGKGGHRNTGKGVFIGEHSIKNYIQRQNTRKTTVTELVNNNFEAGSSKFITLSFRNETITKIDENWDYQEYRFQSIKECNAEFKKFIQRLRYRYPELKYVATIEMQTKNNRNVFHYHMICNLPYIEQKKLMKLWRNGFVWIKNIYDIQGIIDYITKDMKKHSQHMLKGEKGYMYSKGLKRDIIARSWVPDEKILYDKIRERLTGDKGVVVRKSTNKFGGVCEYTYYEDESNLFE